MLAPLAFVLVLSFGITRLSTGTAQLLFWAFATVMGLSMASIFLVYTGTSIATTFFATAAAFGGLSLYGYTTKRDLSAFGTFLIMGVVGLLVAMIINLFLQSGTMSLVISFIGVLLFAGLTAYDTQRIKSLYAQVAGTDMMGKTVIMGALSLYLDFVNMFTFLLQFMGRAVTAALPLLGNADEVIILTVPTNKTNSEEGNRLKIYLLRHGIAATVRLLHRDVPVAEQLIYAANKWGASLLVSGGYTHSRMRQPLFGGVTHNLLENCRITLLLAH